MRSLIITPMQPADWPVVSEIYREGIASGQATFETQVPTWACWDGAHLADARLLAKLDNRILGFAALNPVSARPAYAGVAEVSLYVAAGSRGQGVGKALLEALIGASETLGLWTLQAVIFKENVGSIALHKRCGFCEVGVRERIAELNGIWRDTVLLERRSEEVG